jgi:hypothetical protein
MNKEEILSLFKQAEKDWKRPQRRWQKNKYINRGLCYYFTNKHNLNFSIIVKFLEPYWLKHSFKENEYFHFTNPRNNPKQARKERLEAIRKVIKDLSK